MDAWLSNSWNCIVSVCISIMTIDIPMILILIVVDIWYPHDYWSAWLLRGILMTIEGDTINYIIIYTGLTLSENWPNWVDLAYLDNPPMQNYRSKSETAIIVAGCLKYRRFQFFSPFQSSHFGFLIFVRRFVEFFRCFIGFCSPFQHRQTPAKVCKGRTIQDLLTGRKTCRQQ